MCESYSRSLLRVSVAQICQALGWDSVQVTACDLLTDVLHRYLQQLCRGAHRYSELYGRTDAVLDDVGQAFKLMGVNLNELEDYIHNIEPVTFPHQLPSFPVSKNNVLQFPPPDSKDFEDRKEYIPDYLPLIASSQEEEEEEQVPTDGGTSAEAMQVPLEEEEEEEMEDDEIVNDENYLSKRPLSSPENMEMPFAKRPRLANIKGDVLDGNLEPREPLSSINTQKVPPISPTPIQDNIDLAHSSEPLTLPPVSKSQPPPSKPLESKALNSKSKSKGGSPGQKIKSPKSTPVAAVLGSPMRSPKSGPKEKKSPGRAKSPKSPKSPKGPAAVPVKAETPVRTPLAALSEKIGKENIQIKQTLAPLDTEKLNPETPSKKPSVTDNTIEDSIDAVVARACAEQELDPFEFSSGSESEDEVFTSPKRLTISEPATPKVSSSSSSLAKPGSNPAPPSGGASSSDISWTMDDSINEVIRKVNQETPSNIPGNPQCFSSPSASPPTPEPLLKIFEDKAKLASPVEVKKKAKKEVKAKMKKKDKEKIKEKDKDKERTKDKNKEKNKEKEKDKDGGKESKSLWKDAIRDDETEMQRFKLKDFNDPEVKSKQKENSGKKDKEKHKDKKKDKGKKDKEKKDKGKDKDKNKEDKLKTSAPILLTPKEIALPTISTPSSVRLPSLLSTMSPLLPEKLFEDKEKPKEKDKKKEKKEKKKKKDKEKAKEKDKKEKDKKEKDKDKHKHEKQVKTELSIPAPSPVIPRLTLRVGAGQDTIVISKVVPTPDGKQSAPLALPKSPPPAPSPAPAPVVIPPPPVKAPPVPAAPSPAPKPAPPPAAAGNTSNSKTPVRSVVTETVSVYVIRDEMGNQIWICPGCNKPDDGSPMIGCDGCDDWYHWPCVGIKAEPTEDEWLCKKCDTKKRDKKHKKRKHKAH